MALVERLITYIDGFNLYFGLRSKGFSRYYWLNLWLLSENLLKPGQGLERVRYFTTRIGTRDAAKRKRQVTFLEALETLPGIDIYYGHFLSKLQKCRNCGSTWETFEEKMTDVNIAVELLNDAHDDLFDTALLISGDSDLTTPVRAVRKRYAGKRVVVGFPPNRDSVQLRKAATGYFRIGRKLLQDSQFPDTVQKEDGFLLERPPKWK